MRKLCEGGVAHSFGIHVARLAGVPPEVVLSAEKVLKKLEAGASGAGDSSIKGRVQSLRQKKRRNGTAAPPRRKCSFPFSSSTTLSW